MSLRVRLIAVALANLIIMSIGTIPAAAETLFQMPFPCGETWRVHTWSNHNPPNAVDLNVGSGNDDYGRPVVASAAGTVDRRFAGNDSYGQYIVIDHGGGWETYYAHLASYSVPEGAAVAMGMQIGTVGNNEGALSAHLHYEQRFNGSAVQVRWNGSLVDADPEITMTSLNCTGVPSVTGDRLADLVTLNNNGALGTSMHVFRSTGAAFASQQQWRSTTWGWTGLKPLLGDVTGDGRADLVTLNNNGAAGTPFMVLPSTGTAFGAAQQWRNTTWSWSALKPLLGDVTGDGRADVVTLNNNGTSGTSINVFASTGSSFAAPQLWRNTTWGWGGLKPLLADVTGDGRADLITLNNNGTAGTPFMVFPSTGAAFGAPQQWQSVTWAWTGLNPVVGDVTGDGRADVITLNNNGALGTSMHVFRSTGTAFATQEQWRNTTWGWGGLKPLAGDVTGDGRADLVTLNNNGAAGTPFMVFPSTGSAFGSAQQWQNVSWGWSGLNPLL